MIHVATHKRFAPEKTYITDVLLRDFLGIEFKLEFAEVPGWIVRVPGGGTVVFPDCFFAPREDNWLKPNSVALPSCQRFSIPPGWQRSGSVLAGVESIPSLFHEDGGELLKRDAAGNLCCGLDVFGSAFFFLTRYEELTRSRLDKHGRFHCHASVLHQHALAEWPLVDLYVEVLWEAVRQLAPNLNRRLRSFSLLATHDVDNPFLYRGMGMMKLLTKLAKKRLRHGKAADSPVSLSGWRSARAGCADADPYFCFDWIMDQCEEHGHPASFYFIPCRTHKKDGDYSLEDADIGDLMKRIHKRGHTLGIHPGYQTWTDPVSLGRSVDAFQSALRRLEIQPTLLSGRQHVLRWRNPTTWRLWDQAGIQQDSSVGFARIPGFRCGTCHDFPVYDLEERRALRLREAPLILMETTLFADRYLGLKSMEEAYEYGARLIRRCQQFSGRFVLLWHNNRLVSPEHRELYCQLLKLGSRPASG